MSHKTERTWILVADSSRARIFLEEDGTDFRLALVEAFDFPRGRARIHDLVTDKPGRVRQSGFSAFKPYTSPRTDPKITESQNFARILVHRLEEGCDGAHYDRLVVIAPPHFLGILRELLTKRVTKKLAETVDKDLTHLTERELLEALSAHHAF